MVPIVITTAGTAIQTISITYESWLPGQYVGEVTHNITQSELPAIGPLGSDFNMHTPAGEGQTFDWETSSPGPNRGAYIPISIFGQNQPMNIMQPTTFVYTQIKL